MRIFKFRLNVFSRLYKTRQTVWPPLCYGADPWIFLIISKPLMCTPPKKKRQEISSVKWRQDSHKSEIGRWVEGKWKYELACRKLLEGSMLGFFVTILYNSMHHGRN